MKHLTYLFAATIVGALMLASTASRAQMGGMGMGCCQMKMDHSMDTTHGGHAHAQAQAQATATTIKEGKGTGTITAIDLKEKTLTLRHGDIPGIMMAMTMPYQIDSAAIVKDFKVNDHVDFVLQDRGEGNYFVTEIHTSKQ